MSEIDPGAVALEAADQISEPDAERELGRRRLRKEDARLVTGQTNWTDNIQFPGMVHMAVLRSPMAHPFARPHHPHRREPCAGASGRAGGVQRS